MIENSKLPIHVAVIMDGNGRWAKSKGLPRLAGHNKGMKSMKEIIRHASHMGIQYLTVYAFSTENWKRQLEEVSGIFGLLVKYIDLDLDELDEENVRVRILGDVKPLPQKARDRIERATSQTDKNTGMQFNIALNYGGRMEITRAVNRIVKDMEAGKVEGEVTDQLISSYLYTGEENGNIPDPDLIIRTSGEERLSNFLIWQGAYSELAFTDTLWPDFKPEEFEEICKEFGNRERRFGGRK